MFLKRVPTLFALSKAELQASPNADGAASGEYQLCRIRCEWRPVQLEFMSERCFIILCRQACIHKFLGEVLKYMSENMLCACGEETCGL